MTRLPLSWQPVALTAIFLLGLALRLDVVHAQAFSLGLCSSISFQFAARAFHWLNASTKFGA